MVSTHLIVCEDIREETGGKNSLMGVYGSQVIFSSLPTQLNKLCFRVSFETPISRPIKSLELEIAAGDEPSVKIPIPADTLVGIVNADRAPEAKHIEYIMEVVAAPFAISKEGPIRVSALVNNRKVKVGSLWVKQSETAPVPPVARKATGKAKKKAAKPRLKKKPSKKA